MAVHRAFVCKHKLLFVFAFPLSEPDCARGSAGHRAALNIRPATAAARGTLPSLPGPFEAHGFNFMRLSVITFRSPTLTRTGSLLQKGEDEPANSPGAGRAALTEEGETRGWFCAAYQMGLGNNRLCAAPGGSGFAHSQDAPQAALVHHKR